MTRGMARGIATLVGAAVAGFLIWLAAQMGDDTTSEYWATYGLVAAAGLAMALSQVLGGWTKWGWPRLSLGVFVLGFLPVAIVGLWVLAAQQPGDPWLDTGSWSDDLGVGGVVNDMGELVAAVAFGIGLTLGLTFDTAPREVEVLSWDALGSGADDRAAGLPEPAPADEVQPSGPAQRPDDADPTETDATITHRG